MKRFTEMKEKARLTVLEMQKKRNEMNKGIQEKKKQVADYRNREDDEDDDDDDEESLEEETDDDENQAKSKSQSISIYKGTKDPVCDLECVYGKPKQYMNVNDFKYEGPVKILMYNPGPFTKRKSKEWQAALLTLSFMAMGATTMTIYFYTLSFQLHYSINTHILFCTLAFQFCFPSAYFVENRLSLPSTYMTDRHRRIESFIFRVMALLNVGVGYYFYYMWVALLPSAANATHKLVGMAAVITLIGEFALIIIRIGFMNPYRPTEEQQKLKKTVYNLQNFAGMMTLAFGIGAFATGVQKPAIMQWLPEKQNMGYFIIILSVFYPVMAFCSLNARGLDLIVESINKQAKATRRAMGPPCAPPD